MFLSLFVCLHMVYCLFVFVCDFVTFLVCVCLSRLCVSSLNRFSFKNNFSLIIFYVHGFNCRHKSLLAPFFPLQKVKIAAVKCCDQTFEICCKYEAFATRTLWCKKLFCINKKTIPHKGVIIYA